MTKDKGRKPKLGPATDQSGRPRSKFRGRGRLNNFELLPPNVKLEAERMIENGATFEDTPNGSTSATGRTPHRTPSAKARASRSWPSGATFRATRTCKAGASGACRK